MKLAAPEREVYVLVGDGSYLMLPGELVTAVQEQLKLTIVLVDNHGFNSIGALSRSVGLDGFGTQYRFDARFYLCRHLYSRSRAEGLQAMSKRNRFFAFLGLLLVIAAVYYFLSADHSSDLVLIGTVDANQVVVSPKISGRIERLAIDEGTEVKAGDTIAVLDAQELTADRQAAEAVLASLRHQVSQTRATEEQTAGETSSGVVNAEARLRAAQATLLQAQADFSASRETRAAPLRSPSRASLRSSRQTRLKPSSRRRKLWCGRRKTRSRAAQADL